MEEFPLGSWDAIIILLNHDDDEFWNNNVSVLIVNG